MPLTNAEKQSRARKRAADKLARYEAALREIARLTSLLMQQNNGRWDMRVEHDKRTVGVLMVNQELARTALGDGK